MLISEKSSSLLQNKLQNASEVFCSGLFLSARWAVVSQTAPQKTNLILLPTRESAEYCSADLYNLKPCERWGEAYLNLAEILYEKD